MFSTAVAVTGRRMIGMLSAPMTILNKGFNGSSKRYRFLLSGAAGMSVVGSILLSSVIADDSSNVNGGVGCGGHSREAKRGFKERKVMNYENRIRRFSSPDKIFRYFGTKEVDGDIYMTPDDFIRSITPGLIQPDGLGLDKFEKINLKQYVKLQKESSSGQCGFFSQLGMEGGLISFSDYIFFLSLLTTSPHRFAIAFRMFDLDGNGHVDLAEFSQVSAVIQKATSAGKRHKTAPSFLANASGTVDVSDDNDELTPLMQLFFGQNGKKTLTFKRFQGFVTDLQNEVLKREFHIFKDPDSGLLPVTAFTELLVGHASDKDIVGFLARAKSFNHERCGLTFEEFQDFDEFLKHIDDVEVALSLYTAAGQPVEKVDFIRAAKAVANVSLDSVTVDMVFHIFDRDGDGKLSDREFTAVMKQRLNRGLNNPRDTGFQRGLSSLWQCTKEKMREKLEDLS